MKEYSLFELRLFIKERKNSLVIGIFILFLGVIAWGITQEGVGDAEQEAYEELNQTRLALMTSQQYAQAEGEEEVRSNNLQEQQNLAGRLYNGIIFGNDEWYLPHSLELAELRTEMHEIGIDGIPERLFPPEHEVRQQVQYFSYLEESSLPIRFENQIVSEYVEQVLLTFGVGAFFFLLLIGSTIFINDLEHASMVEAYPINTVQKMISKVGIYSIFSFIVPLIILLSACIILSLLWSLGEFNYPVAYYSLGRFIASPLSHFIVIFFFMFFILSIHVMLLCTLGNRVFKNQYVTIVIGGVLYIAPILFERISGFFFWSPTNFYNLTSVFSGKYAMELHPWVHWQTGVISLMIFSMVIVLAIVWYEKKENGESITV